MPLDRCCRVLIPSLRVIDSRTLNLVFTKFILFLWFSIVFQTKLWWQLQISFFQINLLLVRRPVTILVVISGKKNVVPPSFPNQDIFLHLLFHGSEGG